MVFSRPLVFAPENVVPALGCDALAQPLLSLVFYEDLKTAITGAGSEFSTLMPFDADTLQLDTWGNGVNLNLSRHWPGIFVPPHATFQDSVLILGPMVQADIMIDDGAVVQLLLPSDSFDAGYILCC